MDWDENSFASLEEHAGALTHLAPEWFTLTQTTSELTYSPDAKLRTFAASRGLAVMPLLRNLEDDDWQPEAVENLANGSADKRAAFVRTLVGDLKSANADGVILDWELVDPAYKSEYTHLLTELAEALHDAGLELWFLVSPGDAFETFDLEELSAVVDRFVALLADENSDSDKPGPISSLDWLEGWPEWTPRILDLLKARGVKAAFFLVGQNAEDHPGLVQRILDEGHEIGNHTYSHANLALMSPARMRLELNMTQRLIESITGRSTTLFRPPYHADSNPTKIEELTPLKIAQEELDYTVVLEKVDPQDWA